MNHSDEEQSEHPRPQGGIGDIADANALENARVGYAAAVSLWTNQGDVIWATYNAMLVANSIVLAVAGLLSSSANPSVFISRCLPLAGILLCSLWFALIRRGSAYHSYWVLSARELEEQYLAPVVRTVSRGARFGDGSQVSINIDSDVRVIRISRVGRGFRSLQVSSLVILVFALLYVALFVDAL